MRLPGIVATFRLEATTIKTQPPNAARRPASTAQDNCRQPLKIIVARQKTLFMKFPLSFSGTTIGDHKLIIIFDYSYGE